MKFKVGYEVTVSNLDGNLSKEDILDYVKKHCNLPDKFSGVIMDFNLSNLQKPFRFDFSAVGYSEHLPSEIPFNFYVVYLDPDGEEVRYLFADDIVAVVNHYGDKIDTLYKLTEDEFCACFSDLYPDGNHKGLIEQYANRWQGISEPFIEVGIITCDDR